MPKKKNLIKVTEPQIPKSSIKRKGKKKPPVEFKSAKKFLISIIILLVILLITESVQIFFQFKGFKRETIVQRPVYMVEGQPIDIDTYLREYFVNKIPQKTIYRHHTPRSD